MEIAASRTLPVDRATAWRALMDPEQLKAAIAGCESLERTGENEFTALLVASIGPVKAKFRGKLTLSDIVEPESYTLNFEGQGGPAGFGKGRAEVALVAEGGTTRLDYKVHAQVGGRIAQAGQRLIDAAAAKIADDFFEAFTANLAPAAPGGAPPTAKPAARGLPLGWIVAAIVAAIVVIALLLR